MPIYMGSLTLSDPSDLKIDESVTGVIADDGAIQTAKEQMQALVAEQVSRAAPPEALPPPPSDHSAPDPASAAPSWVPTNGKKIKTNRAVVLENATSEYKRPNILDVKLGTRLWADDAPAAKKARFDRIASETTHHQLGFRIAGMRVFRGSDDDALLDDEGYLIYDKDYGRVTMNSDNILDGFRNFVFNKAAGIDEDLGQAVCAAFAREIGRIQDIMEAHETRMYSSSLLFIFEGDGEALRSAIETNNEIVHAVERKLATRTTLRTDSGIAMGDDDELIHASVLGNGNDELIHAAVMGNGNDELIHAAVMRNGNANQDDDDDDDDDMDSDMESSPQIFSLKLIDFAHAQWTPGQGPDENLLRGVRSLRGIFEQLAG